MKDAVSGGSTSHCGWLVLKICMLYKLNSRLLAVERMPVADWTMGAGHSLVDGRLILMLHFASKNVLIKSL